VLNPTDKSTTTSLVEDSYRIDEIPTPLEFCIGKMIGVTLLRANVFSSMSTLLIPKVSLRSASGTKFPVFPSNTRSFGAEVYPLPKEITSIVSNDDNGSTFITCGIDMLGLTVKSEGKLNPMSLILVVFILPIDLLEGSKIDPTPSIDLIDVICGRE
jgi:hypothetical protein